MPVYLETILRVLKKLPPKGISSSLLLLEKWYFRIN